MPVAEPVHPATKFRDGFHLRHQMPVVAHQAITPQLDGKLCDGTAQKIKESGKHLGLAEKHLPVVAPIQDIEDASLKQATRNPWHDPLLSCTAVLGKKRCLSRMALR